MATATAIEALSWAWATFEDQCCDLSSMQDATVIDLALQVDERFPVVFLDNGYHFAETWETLRRVEDSYGIEVEVIGPAMPPRADLTPGACCDQKPQLLEQALRSRTAWVSGIRRSQTKNRATAPLIGTDTSGRTKINPLAQWSDTDVARLVSTRSIPRNPLLDRGFLSVGCEPCTTATQAIDDPRSGRWAGTGRVECGLHL